MKYLYYKKKLEQGNETKSLDLNKLGCNRQFGNGWGQTGDGLELGF